MYETLFWYWDMYHINWFSRRISEPSTVVSNCSLMVFCHVLFSSTALPLLPKLRTINLPYGAELWGVPWSDEIIIDVHSSHVHIHLLNCTAWSDFIIFCRPGIYGRYDLHLIQTWSYIFVHIHTSQMIYIFSYYIASKFIITTSGFFQFCDTTGLIRIHLRIVAEWSNSLMETLVGDLGSKRIFSPKFQEDFWVNPVKLKGSGTHQNMHILWSYYHKYWQISSHHFALHSHVIGEIWWWLIGLFLNQKSGSEAGLGGNLALGSAKAAGNICNNCIFKISSVAITPMAYSCKYSIKFDGIFDV